VPMLFRSGVAVAAALVLLAGCEAAAPGGDPVTGTPGTSDGGATSVAHGGGVGLSSPLIERWAVALGPGGYEPGDGAETLNDPDAAIGRAAGSNAGVVVLGSAGRITLDMDTPFGDGEGADLAVWENGIAGANGTLFAELASVSVSSDGVSFVSFPVLDREGTPVNGYDGTFGYVDPTRYSGFAGLHPVGTGTAFDLTELRDDPAVLSGAVDLNAIRYVRITDVVGDGGETDAAGNPIYDPYPTYNPEITTNTAGFDLDGVAVLRAP
jgi:hypothetical protein